MQNAANVQAERAERGEKPCDVLVVSAFGPELGGLEPPPKPSEAVGLSIAVRVVGVGMIAAAAGTATCLEQVRPRVVLMTGTCGAYPGVPLRVNDVVIARRIMLVEPAVEDGRAALPGPMAKGFDAHAGGQRELVDLGAQAGDVATTLGITTDDGLAAALARTTGAAAEHLEAYGVALACAACGVPFLAALGVANVVGSKGRAGWLAGHGAATAAVNALLLEWLRGGAKGALPLQNAAGP